jgi:hypothetical protein
MPYPDKGEKQNDFIQRAIKEFISEGHTQKQAVGRAHGFWKTYKVKGNKPKNGLN